MARSWGIARLSSLALAVAIGAACGGDDGPMALDPAEFELATVSGGGQSGLAGTVLLDPLLVRVQSRSTGAPEPGVTVNWQAITGSGSPTRSSSATNGQGLASTRTELGANAGDVVIEASVAGLPAVTFDLTVLPAPALMSVTPGAVSAGDTVDVQLTNVPTGQAVEVLFDGVAGEIVSQSVGPPIVVRVIVPAPVGMCEATVQTVPVRARIAGLTTGSVNLSVTVPQNPFQVGQVLVVQGTTDVQCALLPADAGSAKYLLVALSSELEVNGQFQVTLGAGNIALSVAQGARSSGNEGFHHRLRALEQQIASRGLPAAQPPSGARLFAEPALGSQRQFWVLNNVGSTSGSLDQGDFDRITAILKFKSTNTLLYLDTNAPTPGLSQVDLDFLGELYDQRLYGADVDFFGEPSDVDGNGQVIVLLSPVVNALTERDAEGVIIGFFFGLDLFSPNSSNCSECRFSNGGEVFYGLVPDPGAVFSDARNRDRVLELLPGVMVHETQHMISFRYKVFENSGLTLETLWLSEALAHAAEEIGGDEVDASGQTSVAEDLYEANLGRALRYLQEPSLHSLTTVDGSGSLEERGAGWLFLRWIADQYGDFIFRDMTQAVPNGVANVEAQTGETFFRLFADWAVAIWADDQSIPNLPQRYQIPKWRFRDALQVGNPPVYALKPLSRTFGTFRADSIAQFLAATSPYYLELEAAGDTVALQLQLSASTAAGLAILRFE